MQIVDDSPNYFTFNKLFWIYYNCIEYQNLQLTKTLDHISKIISFLSILFDQITFSINFL